jgi:uncharacterized protein
MQYRTLGKTGLRVSVLGFGAMRLPTQGQPGSAEINFDEASTMIYRAIEGGVNYFDTAYVYHRQQSETFLGQALSQAGLREQVTLATKMPHWLMKGPEEFDPILAQQLERLQTDHIDLYLLHGIDKKSFTKLQEWQVFEWAQKPLADGRIRHLGFSFHDDVEAFKAIVDAYDWGFCQIQYNYMDVQEQAGTEGLQYAAAKGLGLVIMEPLLGGKLAGAPEAVRAIWDKSPIQRAPVEWALDWLWNQPEVTVTLSGMSTLEQVEQNLAFASQARPGNLSAAELALVDEVRAAYQAACLVSCTGCQYCQPCPQEINIPFLFELYNAGHMYGGLQQVRDAFTRWVPVEKRPDQCAKCRECEDKCPQHLPICDLLETVDLVLAGGKSYEEVLHR